MSYACRSFQLALADALKKGALVPVEVQAGDVVLWQSYRSAPQPVADGVYLIDAAEIMGVIYRSSPGPAAA